MRTSHSTVTRKNQVLGASVFSEGLRGSQGLPGFPGLPGSVDTTDFQTTSVLIRSLRGAGKLQEAKALYESCINKIVKPYNESQVLFLCEAGHIEVALENYADAEALYKRAHPKPACALIKLYRDKLDNTDMAFSVCWAALGQNRNEPTVLYQRALTFIAVDKFDKAQVDLEKAKSLKPDLAHVHTKLGKVLLHFGKFAEATSEFKQAVALDPKDKTAWCELGDCYSFNRDYELARKALLRAIEIDEKLASARIVLAKVLTRLGDLSEAELHLNQAESCSDPANFKMHALTSGNIAFRRGIIFLSRHEIDQAKQQFESVPRHHIHVKDAMVARAYCGMLENHQKEADQIISRLLKGSPSFTSALLASADLRRLSGDCLGAESICRRAHENLSSSYVARIHFAKILIVNGKDGEAARILLPYQNNRPRLYEIEAMLLSLELLNLGRRDLSPIALKLLELEQTRFKPSLLSLRSLKTLAESGIQNVRYEAFLKALSELDPPRYIAEVTDSLRLESTSEQALDRNALTRMIREYFRSEIVYTL